MLGAAALIGGSLLLASCSTVKMAPSNPVSVAGDAFGFCHAGQRSSPKEYRLLDEFGAVWMRNTFRWDKIQTASKRWDFARFDHYVAGAEAAGKKILAVLAYDVGWIYGETEARRNIVPGKLPYFLQYVEGVVARYRGKVDAYEIWNEPNWMFWKGSEEDFIVLTEAAIRKIKEVDPAAKVVAGSFFRVPAKFLRKMLEAGALKEADAVSFHPYALSPLGVAEQCDELRAILDEFGFKGEIWVTEIGFPSEGWYLSRFSDEDKPGVVLKTLAALTARGVRVVFWYELFDQYSKKKDSSTLDSELFFGLAGRDYRKKAGAVAYSLFAMGTAGSDYRPDLLSAGKGVEAFLYRRKDGRGILLLFRNDADAREVSIEFSGTGAIADIVTGKRTPIVSGSTLKLTSVPAFVEFAGLEAETRVRVVER